MGQNLAPVSGVVKYMHTYNSWNTVSITHTRMCGPCSFAFVLKLFHYPNVVVAARCGSPPLPVLSTRVCGY